MKLRSEFDRVPAETDCEMENRLPDLQKYTPLRIIPLRGMFYDRTFCRIHAFILKLSNILPNFKNTVDFQMHLWYYLFKVE